MFYYVFHSFRSFPLFAVFSLFTELAAVVQLLGHGVAPLVPMLLTRLTPAQTKQKLVILVVVCGQSERIKRRE